MKPFPSRLLLAVALATNCLLGAAAARAQTAITSLPYTITAGGAYVLNANLSSTQTSGSLITVNASNVTIDFQNHYISGPAGGTNTVLGVSSTDHGNITLKNGTISHCQYGVYFTADSSVSTNSENHQIDNLRVTHCSYVGIELVACPASRVTNCQISETGVSGSSQSYGISGSGAGLTIQGNVIANGLAQTSYGINLGATCIVRQNTISGVTYGVYGGKYQDNLTSNCPNPYSGGLDAGGNN